MSNHSFCCKQKKRD